MNRGIGEARSRVDRDAEHRCRTGARLPGEAAAATGACSPRARSCTAGSTDLIDGTFDLTCRGGTTWRAGSGRADGPLLVGTAAHLLAAVDRRAVSRRACSAKSDCSRSVSSRISKMSISDCAAPRAGSRACMFRKRVAWHRGSASAGPMASGNGAADRAQSAAVGGAPLSAHYAWWPILVAQFLWGAVALRHGRRLRVAAGVSRRVCGVSRKHAEAANRCQDCSNNCCENERTIYRAASRDGVRQLLEAVFPAHRRWGKVTHVRHRHRHRHL